MTIDYKIWDFPTFPISGQLFYVPGQSLDGGMTSGGARLSSPEPGGRSVLQIRVALQVTEWDYPLSSWVMSKTNGEIFRMRLAPTPQVASSRVSGTPWGAESIYPDAPWSNLENWDGDLTAIYSGVGLEGDNTAYIDMSDIGPLLRQGHVIGHKFNSYIIDDIAYSISGIATITVKPPLRKNIAIGDSVYFRPYFTGSIRNGDQMRTTYDADKVGNIQMQEFILDEVVL